MERAKNQVKIPCPKIFDKNPCEGLLDIESLIEYKKRGYEEYQCDVCKNWIIIDELLANKTKTHEKFVTHKQFDTYEQIIIGKLNILDAKADAIYEQGRVTNSDVHEVLSRMDEYYGAFFNILTDKGIEGPRLFICEIIKPSWRNPGWISQKVRITLCCEHSKIPVPILSEDPKCGVYDFDIPREWLVKAIPYMHLVSSVLSIVLPPVKVFNSIIDDNSYANLKNGLQLSIAEIESFVKTSENLNKNMLNTEKAKIEKEILISQGMNPSGQSINKLSEQHSAGLRVLQNLIKEKDHEYFGGLLKLRTKQNKVIWVHEKFKEEYILPPPEM